MSNPEIILKGIPICRGVAIGKPFFFSFVDEATPTEFPVMMDHVGAEITRYSDALAKSREEIQRLQHQLEQAHMHEGASILEAQLQMTRESLFTSEIEEGIRTKCKNAENILHTIVLQYQKKFHALADPFFRERFKDVEDISRRILSHLRTSVRVSLANLPPNSVVFSRELTPSDTAEAHMSSANAFVTEFEGTTSHAAIVARARGTPYVSSIDLSKIESNKHEVVIVDGRTGEIILSPTEQTLAKYQIVRTQLETNLSKLQHIGALKTETYDGHAIRLSANVEMANELDMLHQHGGHGVGLFRSEYILLAKENMPSEDEQSHIYCDLVKKMQGLPIVIRTFDIGGDKHSPAQPIVEEGTPFLGCRAIRLLLREPEIFKTQIRAILRASVHGNVSMMFPMVSTLSELIEAKQLIVESQKELQRRNVTFGKLRVGCMIEVPSAAIIADLLAKECDFLSIGTNDLVQYALAVDRGNHTMSALYRPTHPSMIRLIKLVVHEASQQGIPVSVCGEVAADPRFTALLLGLGIQELSVATRYIPTIKQAIRNTSIVEANYLAEKALNMSTASEIESLLDETCQLPLPNNCF